MTEDKTQQYIAEGKRFHDYIRDNEPACNCHCGCIAETYNTICIGCRHNYHLADAERDAGL